MSLPVVRLNPAWLSGWDKRKIFTVNNSGTERRQVVVDLTVFNTSGTDTATEVYLNGNVRSDWGDIRVTRIDGTTHIPFGILRREATFVEIAIKVPVAKAGNTQYILYYDGPAPDVYKIANLTDVHYDSAESHAERDESLTYIQNFKTRMTTWAPDLAVHCGDKIGTVTTGESNCLALYQDTIDEFAGVTATVVRDGIAPGNHDFEDMSFANVLAKHAGEAWRNDPTKPYDYWESDDYRFITLDANYSPGTDTHLSLSHQGFGFINPAQQAWLRSTLEDSTKECIVYCHQLLCEADAEQFNPGSVPSSAYHTQNRKLVRSILEKSQKVVAVIHGHMHKSRVDVIRGIPYIAVGNISNDPNFGEVPITAQGRLGLFRFDRSSRVINYIFEIFISGNYETMYESYIPFGKTSLVSDRGSDPEETFAFIKNPAAPFNKSSYLRDPVQMFAESPANLWKYPNNFQTPDDSDQMDSIRVQGRNNDPNWGRAYWFYETISTGFMFKGRIMMGDNSSKAFKFGGRQTGGISGNPKIYIAFTTSGNINIFNSTTPVTVGTYTLGQWYKFEVFADIVTGLFSVYLDGTLVANGFSFWSTVDNYFRQMEIVTETGDVWLNSFSVRRWFDPMPAITGFAAEETA